ncbi:LytR C-terminal domain-containing protein [Pseudarthrobacter sp. P1]|uniref:LytR C-terminal domain-containing protein n=1 Tax=Pseudarthrobacter sp. P1 TaxID=3418418 RepID=UPI003CFA94FB
MSTYPRDEFDKIPENSSRHGVHRTSIAPARNSLFPLMAFGVLALIVGLAAFFVLPRLGIGGSGNVPPAAVATTDTATTGAAPTENPPASETPSVPASESASPGPTEPPAAVDKSVPVQVFNASGISGLAAKYSGIISSAGWGVNQTANWTGAIQPSSVVFYSVPAQKANAEALAQLLGIPRTAELAELAIPLAVVLGPGAQ